MNIETVIVLSLMGVGAGVFTFFRRGRCNIKIKTPYSNMWIRDEKTRRVLYFIHEGGFRVLESAMDPRYPDRLIVPYSRVMMASYLCMDNVGSSLILGLGGASMVKFINRYFPRTRIDIVEIDPEVLRIARTYFHFREHEKARVFIQDAAEYIGHCSKKYDVIYVDVYTSKSAKTDTNGVPFTAKSREYYQSLSRLLNPGGVIAFNINHSAHIDDDLNIIRDSYKNTMMFTVPRRRNLVMIASNNENYIPIRDMYRRADDIDRKGYYHNFTFTELPGLIIEHPEKRKAEQLIKGDFASMT